MKVVNYSDKCGSIQYCVLLERFEIEYDVEVTAVAAAKTIYHDGAPDMRTDVVDAAKQKDFLDRCIDTAINNVKTKIRFAVQRNSRMASDEITEDAQQYVIPLRFEKEWQEEPETLCSAIHEYVVKFTLSRWAEKIGFKSDYYAQAEEELTRIHDIACCYVLNPVKLYEGKIC